MPNHPLTRPVTWFILILLVVLAAVVLWASPPERTLGQEVKLVYTHVALTRSGAVGLYVAGALGLLTLALNHPALTTWMRLVSRVGLGLYLAGFLISGIAQVTIWGGIAWQEPRVLVALNTLALAAIVQVLSAWVTAPRVQGALHAGLAIYLAYTILSAQDVLHPASAIGSSESAAIQLYAVGLLALALAIGGWIVWSFRPRLAAASN